MNTHMRGIMQTELRWGYSPPDLFEGPQSFQTQEGIFMFDGGHAALMLPTPMDPVPASTMNNAREALGAILVARQLRTRRVYRLNDAATIHQHSATGVSATITTGAGKLIATGAALTADVAVVDSVSGEVSNNSGEMRRQADATFVATLAPKIARSPVLRALADIYQHAADDQQNELVHLYEIKDALASHFQGLHLAKRAFPGADTHLSTLGRLADNGPLREGRHRGRHLGQLRPATNEELNDARHAALELILGFASTLP
jgi:hypothetical protein